MLFIKPSGSSWHDLFLVLTSEIIYIIPVSLSLQIILLQSPWGSQTRNTKIIKQMLKQPPSIILLKESVTVFSTTATQCSTKTFTTLNVLKKNPEKEKYLYIHIWPVIYPFSYHLSVINIHTYQSSSSLRSYTKSKPREPTTHTLTLSTLARVLAEVSTYGTPHWLALFLASASDTFLRSVKSALFPTSRKGMCSSFFTRSICSLES